MHPLLTSIVLFLVANAAAAQPVDTTAVVAPVHAAPSLIQTSAAPAGEQLPKPASADLIKTAAAGPREVAMRQSPAAGPAKPSVPGDEDEPRRTGPAMLIAALAVMTAIALRRSGGSGR